ncbi:hypothetical protein KSP40_PGU009193 [Platanthera guangdongensis]|uniref:Uncharacterized protein n=1 Tax=Platanthera guangdongensis TaxID=2320717 RepID=A0ABR2LDL0_9ASPA
MIRNMFRYNPSRYSGMDDVDDNDMEAGFSEIEQEELRRYLMTSKRTFATRKLFVSRDNTIAKDQYKGVSDGSHMSTSNAHKEPLDDPITTHYFSTDESSDEYQFRDEEAINLSNEVLQSSDSCMSKKNVKTLENDDTISKKVALDKGINEQISQHPPDTPINEIHEGVFRPNSILLHRNVTNTRKLPE